MSDRVTGIAATTPVINGDSGRGFSSLNRAAAPGPELSLDQALQALNAHFGAQEPPLTFHTSRNEGDLIVTVIDTRDNHVVRQIPSEEVLDLARRLARGFPTLIAGQTA